MNADSTVEIAKVDVPNTRWSSRAHNVCQHNPVAPDRKNSGSSSRIAVPRPRIVISAQSCVEQRLVAGGDQCRAMEGRLLLEPPGRGFEPPVTPLPLPHRRLPGGDV